MLVSARRIEKQSVCVCVFEEEKTLSFQRAYVPTGRIPPAGEAGDREITASDVFTHS